MKEDNKRNTSKEKAKRNKGFPYKRKALRKEPKDINPRYLFVMGFFLITITFIQFGVVSNTIIGLVAIGIAIGMAIETVCRQEEEELWE